VRYGYRRTHIPLTREGTHINKKRKDRQYIEDSLQLRSKRPQRHVTAATRRPPRAKPQAPNADWSMDSVSDQTASGQRFRALIVADVFSRECPAIEPGQKFCAADVIYVLSRIAAEPSSPRRIYCDNGSEFSSRLVDLWAYANKVVMEFSRPGKPTDNAFIQSFNGTLWDECQIVYCFNDLTDANIKLQAWQRKYNESRRHRCLNELSPLQHKAHWAERRSKIR
jgi:putative transposase